MAVELRNISKTYLEGGKRQSILSGVNAVFPSGRFSVILGKSGSGKSTLLNLIGGIDTPDTGEIVIENKKLTQLSDYDRTIFRRRHLGFVFQFFNLIPTLTVMENTMLVKELDGSANREAFDLNREILREVGLEKRMNAKPDNLSGGEQQRVAIARAISHNPDVILADEPTGNLDLETGRDVLNLLVNLLNEKGKTLIMATHSEEALSAADAIFQIENGAVIPISVPDKFQPKT